MLTFRNLNNLADLWRCEIWEVTPLLISSCNHTVVRETVLWFSYFEAVVCEECGYYYTYDLQECEVI